MGESEHQEDEFASEILMLGPDIDHPRMAFAVARGQLGMLSGQFSLLVAQVDHHL